MTSPIQPYVTFLVLSPLFPYSPLALQLIPTFTKFLHFSASLLLHMLTLCLAGMLNSSSLFTKISSVLQHSTQIPSPSRNPSPLELKSSNQRGLLPSVHPTASCLCFLNCTHCTLPRTAYQCSCCLLYFTGQGAVFYWLLSTLTKPKCFFAHKRSSYSQTIFLLLLSFWAHSTAKQRVVR